MNKSEKTFKRFVNQNVFIRSSSQPNLESRMNNYANYQNCLSKIFTIPIVFTLLDSNGSQPNIKPKILQNIHNNKQKFKLTLPNITGGKYLFEKYLKQNTSFDPDE